MELSTSFENQGLDAQCPLWVVVSSWVLGPVTAPRASRTPCTMIFTARKSVNDPSVLSLILSISSPFTVWVRLSNSLSKWHSRVQIHVSGQHDVHLKMFLLVLKSLKGLPIIYRYKSSNARAQQKLPLDPTHTHDFWLLLKPLFMFDNYFHPETLIPLHNHWNLNHCYPRPFSVPPDSLYSQNSPCELFPKLYFMLVFETF